MGTIPLKTPVNTGVFYVGRSVQTNSAVSQNESESRFAERFADSAANPQFHEPVIDRRKRRVRGLWLHQGELYGRLYFRTPDDRWRDRRVHLEAKTLVDARKELSDLKQRASSMTRGQSFSGTVPDPASVPVPESPLSTVLSPDTFHEPNSRSV